MSSRNTEAITQDLEAITIGHSSSLGRDEIPLMRAEKANDSDVHEQSLGLSNAGLKTVQPQNSILSFLSDQDIETVFEYVGQYDLPRLCLTCKLFSTSARKRLYKNISVSINPTIPKSYNGDIFAFFGEYSLQRNNVTTIMTIRDIQKFLNTLETNTSLVSLVRHFYFENCYGSEEHPKPFVDTETNKAYGKEDMIELQWKFTDIFEEHGTNTILGISYIKPDEGLERVDRYLANEGVRGTSKWLRVTKPEVLVTPFVPPRLGSLSLEFDDDELLLMEDLDTSREPYSILYDLQTMKCLTPKLQGLEILNKIKLDSEEKLQLKTFSLFHQHTKEPPLEQNEQEVSTDSEEQRFARKAVKKLSFPVLKQKLDLLYLTDLRLNLECQEVHTSRCSCFRHFYEDFTCFSKENDGMPNLKTFEVGSFAAQDWLRPHRFLSEILEPLSDLLGTLNGLKHLIINFYVVGPRMFDKNSGISGQDLTSLSESAISSFFLKISKSKSRLKSLKLKDFFTSFIYYVPLFYLSLLHTCKCWGCEKVMRTVENLYFPIPIILREEQETLCFLYFGFILAKMLCDRELYCPGYVPVTAFDKYALWKGHPDTLHDAFHATNGEEYKEAQDEFGVSMGFASLLHPKECRCSKVGHDIDGLMATYLIHQMQPINAYLQTLFSDLELLMLHGVYFQLNKQTSRFEAVYDDEVYAELFVADGQGKSWLQYGKPFGKFNLKK